MRIPTLALASIAVASWGCGQEPAVSADRSQQTDTVIAIVAGGLERLRTGDPGGITDVCAEDVTYYSVEYDSILVGRQTLVDMYGPPTNQTYYDHFDLINPTVQIHGDVAVLAFDFASFTTEDDSELRTRWRSTYVLVLSELGWRIVHIHWTLLENNLE